MAAGLAAAAAFFNGSVPDATPFSTSPYGTNPGTADWQAAYVMIAHSLLLGSSELNDGLLAGRHGEGIVEQIRRGHASRATEENQTQVTG